MIIDNALGNLTAALSAQVAIFFSPPDKNARCCHALYKTSLGSNVYFPNSTLYDARIDSYWSVSAALPPTCMVLPSTSDDVSLIVKTLARHSCPFGIRGGGHGSFALSNSVREGVTIDFGHMNSTTYNNVTKIASIQPGSNWQHVYETLTPHGVTVTGGRAGTVGVGGFIVGGGNSFHSASHGFACDNVQNFELVLADGSIANANVDENADLWRALKGGSANFGLVTRFDMYAIEFPSANDTTIWGGILSYDLSASDVLIENYVAFADNVVNDQNSSSILIWDYNPSASGMSLILALENTINAVSPLAFGGYLSIPGITSNSLRSAPMYEITAELGASEPAGLRNIWFTGGYKNDARVIKFAVEKHAEIVVKIQALTSSDSGFHTLCMFQPITQIIVQHSNEKGGNSLGLEDRVADGNGVMFLAAISINGADNEAAALPLMQEWFDAVDEYATSLGANWNWRYLNYAGKTQEPIASYGAASVERLKAVSAKYDPDRFFQTLRKSGFKIPA